MIEQPASRRTAEAKQRDPDCAWCGKCFDDIHLLLEHVTDRHLAAAGGIAA